MTRAAPQPDFWQRRSARRAPPPIERRTHIALADLLRHTCRPGWWWSHIPSGEYRSEKTGALLKRMGTQRGMLDFLLISPTGAHHWLELKRGSAPLTEAQQAFIEQLNRRGVPWFVARDYDAAVRQLKEWGVL
jgi:VRR-NUC domain